MSLGNIAPAMCLLPDLNQQQVRQTVSQPIAQCAMPLFETFAEYLRMSI